MSTLIERKEEKVQKLSREDLLKEGRKRHAAQRERDMELVTGVFRFVEHPGGSLHFRFHKYEGDGYPHYELKDGQIYKLPRMVARNLNKNVNYIQYQPLDKQIDKLTVNAGYNNGQVNTTNRMTVVNRIPRCEFKSLEFMDEDLEMNAANLSTVERIQ